MRKLNSILTIIKEKHICEITKDGHVIVAHPIKECKVTECQCQFGALLIRLLAEGKKLFLWREVLVMMDRSLLPEGSG